MTKATLKYIGKNAARGFAYLSLVICALFIINPSWAADCVYYFDGNNLAQLSSVGESKGNYGINNYYTCNDRSIKNGNCSAEDKGKGGCFGNGPFAGKDSGGCSYGKNQMACLNSTGKGSTVDTFLTTLSKTDPALFSQISGGASLEDTLKYACNDQAYPEQNKAFRDAFKNASSNPTFQGVYDAVITQVYSPAAKQAAKNAGLDWNSLSKEVQMTLVACSIASPGLVKNGVADTLKAKYGENISNISDADLVQTINDARAEIGYKSYLKKGNASTYYAAKERAKADDIITLQSIQIREALQDPKNAGKTADQIAQELFKKSICKEGEVADIKVQISTTGGSSYGSSKGGYTNYDSPKGGTKVDLGEFKASKECRYSSYRESYVGCFFCDMFKVLFITSSDLAKNSFNALTNAVSKLVMIGFALWLAMTILKYISAMEQKEPRTLFKMILNQAFIVFIIVSILQMDSATFFSWSIDPLFNTGMRLAQMASSGGTCGDKFGIPDNGGLPASMGISILCTIKAIQDKILDVMALASTSICVSVYIKSFKGIPFLPHLGYFLVGVLLWIASFLYMVIYPFLLIDAVLQLTVATALLPAALGAFAFKITRSYMDKIVNAFFNCMFTFLFLTIIIYILTTYLQNTVTKTFTGDLVKVGNGSDYQVILDKVIWWGKTFLEIIFIMLLGWATLDKAKDWAGEFSMGGFSMGGIGSSVGTTAMSGAKGVAAPMISGAAGAAAGVAGGAAGAVKKVGGAALGGMVRKGGEMYQNASIGYQAWRMRNNANAQRDANGNLVVQSKSWFRRRDVTKVLSTDADGRQQITRTKSSGSGTSASMADSYMNIKTKTDGAGNVTSEKLTITAAVGKRLLNKDGSVNNVAVNAVRGGSQQSGDMVDKAIMNQMLKERMPDIKGANLDGEFQKRTFNKFTDDKGNEVMSLSQINKDGTRSNFKVTMQGNRALTEYESIDKKGNAKKFASDGIMHKRSSYQYNKDGTNGDFGTINENTEKSRYSLSSHYMNNGQDDVWNGVPKDEIMFGKEDLQAFRAQVSDNHDGTPLKGFK